MIPVQVTSFNPDDDVHFYQKRPEVVRAIRATAPQQILTENGFSGAAIGDFIVIKENGNHEVVKPAEFAANYQELPGFAATVVPTVKDPVFVNPPAIAEEKPKHWAGLAQAPEVVADTDTKPVASGQDENDEEKIN